jgi:long-subunit fatty acid transport protein
MRPPFRLPLAAALSTTTLVAGLGADAAAQSLQNVVLQNSFTPSGAGARAVGMGGAFIAVADDGTAASFNPAGLSQLQRSELALVYFARQVNSAIDVDGTWQLNENDVRARQGGIDFAGLALPFELGTRRLTVQLSYQRAVDLFGKGNASIAFPIDTSSALVPPGTEAQYSIGLASSQSGALHTVSLASGLDVAGPLSIGASLNFWSGSWRASGTETEQLHLHVPDELDASVPSGVTRFDQDQRLSGLSLNLGVLLHSSWLRVGGMLRLPFDGNYRLAETRSFTDPDGGMVPEDYRMRSRLHWPRSVGLGVALRPFRRLTVALDFVHTEWSQTVLDNVPNGALLANPVVDAQGVPVADRYEDRNFFDLFPASQTLTSDSGQWRAGIEYLLTFPHLVVPLRVGAFHEQSPVPDLALREARSVDGFTLGWGLNFDRVVFDVAYEARYTKGTTGALLTPDFRQSLSTYSTENVVYQRVVASLIVRPGRSGSEDPLIKALRRLFGG